MNTQKYVSFRRGNHQKLKHRITGAVIIVLIVFAAMFVVGKLTANSDKYRQKVSLVEENRVLREQVEALTARIEELEGTVSEQKTYISSLPTEEPAEDAEESEGFDEETPRD